MQPNKQYASGQSLDPASTFSTAEKSSDSERLCDTTNRNLSRIYLCAPSSQYIVGKAEPTAIEKDKDNFPE